MQCCSCGAAAVECIFHEACTTPPKRGRGRGSAHRHVEAVLQPDGDALDALFDGKLHVRLGRHHARRLHKLEHAELGQPRVHLEDLEDRVARAAAHKDLQAEVEGARGRVGGGRGRESCAPPTIACALLHSAPAQHTHPLNSSVVPWARVRLRQ